MDTTESEQIDKEKKVDLILDGIYEMIAIKEEKLSVDLHDVKVRLGRLGHVLKQEVFANGGEEGKASGVRVNALVSWLKQQRKKHQEIATNAMTSEIMNKHNFRYKSLKFVIEKIELEYKEAN